ncbi:MAG: Chromate transport protein [Chroococcopsis gigantea SAG 12.99]|nr:chromate efflux transporter [Chlorogloea purpurea SAG 13.99]MDV3001915.1 Chromate transport protein [Chroococcopsis gigantea SAG 12.99]
MNNTARSGLVPLALLFLKLGVIGFGGPAAHIAMMEDEVVKRRQWMTRQEFLDLVGATNLIPGPNSTEMAIHIGYIQGGLAGLIIGGVCFIGPAVIITGIIAWFYSQYGTLPEVAPFFSGIQPIIIAVIIQAVWQLGKKALKKGLLWAIATLVIVLVFLGVNEMVALLLGGISGIIAQGLRLNFFLLGLTGGISLVKNPGADNPPHLAQLGLFFLKVGSILFGSGYVLVAFLQSELVNKYSWLTQQELLDAIAIGQFTPGPVLSTATFIGYQILGLPGAMISTIAIFFPSFIFVLLLNPLIPKIRQSKRASAFLDAVNASAVALMVAVIINLSHKALLQPMGIFPVNITAIFMTVLATILLIKYKVNSSWLIIGGALAGFLLESL